MDAMNRTGKTGRGAKADAQARMLNLMHQIWLAGLGAVAKAQAGAPKVLEELITEGAKFQADTRGAAEEAVRSMMGSVQARFNAGVAEVRGQANDVMENLEKVFQSRVHRALAQLGVPSAAQVQALSKRVDALNSNIDRLARRSTGASKSRAGGKAAPSRRRRAAR
jgi:poly(hydroxyalkanoate) granule-associated protein